MTKERILVVEDEALVAEELREDLERLGYAVAGVVASGEQVLEAVSEGKPDLVLMDVRLNGIMDGIEAAFQTKAEFDIPIIYLSAYSDDETLRRAAVTAPTAYLIKPFNERELAANIAMALSSHKTRSSTLDKLRGNEPLVEALEVPGLLLDSEGLIIYANRAALTYLKIRDLSFIRNESITRFVDVGTREDPDRPCLIVAADGSTGYAIVKMESLSISNGDRIGALVLFERMSDKERGLLESSASALNKAILAKLPQADAAGPGYRLGGFVHPSPSGTGDLYDVFPIGDDRLCFYILDVMGHGPLAALIAWSMRELIHSVVAEDPDANPASVLSWVNQLYRNRSFVPETFFISIVLGFVRKSTGSYILGRAGHPPCIHVRNNKDPLLLWGSGTALGIAEDLNIEEIDGKLLPGDKIILTSDGIIESFCEKSERLEHTLYRIAQFSEQALEDLTDTMENHVRDHFLTDDASIMILERL